jgi:ribonuclease BN (tRNA processing enzyme)
MIEVIVLGSGTCVPSVRRAGPATCVRAEGQTVVVDSAAGTLRQMVKAGIPYDAVDLILYTHFHPDHIGDLVPFLFAMKYAPGYRRSSPVMIMAAEGFNDFYRLQKKAFGPWVDPGPGKVVIEEIPQGFPAAMQLPPLTIRCASVNHTAQSLAYRIETPEGKSVCVSGDTDFCNELIELASGADLLVCECAAPECCKISGHLIPSEAGRIAHEAGVGKLLLTHFYPNCDENDMVSPCSKIYGGEIILAEDLLRLTV